MDPRWLNGQAQHPHTFSSPAVGRHNAAPPEAPPHGGTDIPAALSRHSQQVEPPNHGGNLIPRSVARQAHWAVQPAPLGGPAGHGATAVHAVPTVQPSRVQVSPQPAQSPYNTFGAPQSQPYQQRVYQQQPYQALPYQQPYQQPPCPQQQYQQQPYQFQQQANTQYLPDHRQSSTRSYQVGYPFLAHEFKLTMLSNRKHRPNINSPCHLPRNQDKV